MLSKCVGEGLNTSPTILFIMSEIFAGLYKLKVINIIQKEMAESIYKEKKSEKVTESWKNFQ